jgi:hypothetical protein
MGGTARTAVACVCSSPPPWLPQFSAGARPARSGKDIANSRDGGASGPSLTQAHTRAEAYRSPA